RGEHLLKHGERLSKGLRGKLAQPPHESLVIHGANLVKDYVPGAPGEPAPDAKWIWMSPGCERSHDKRAYVGVELVGRHDHAWRSFTDLPAPGWIQLDQENLAAVNRVHRYHCHSSSSNRVPTGPSRSRSSFRSRN